jgi:uncharacterized iron-regulated membrane protein
MSVRLRGRLRRWMGLMHLWLGLALGVVLAVAGITGALLVFYVEGDRALDARLRAIDPEARPASYEAVLRSLQAHAPQRPGAWRIEVTGEGGPIPVRYYNPPETAGRDFAPLMLWVDPQGPRVVREAFWGEYLGTWLYDVHYALLMGRAGKQLMAVCCVLTLGLLLGGLWLWWPAKGKAISALTLKPSASPQRRIYDLHKTAGVYGLVPLLVLVVSGGLLAAPDWVRPGIACLSPLYEAPAPQSTPVASAGRIPVDTAVASARRLFPAAELAWIETPAGPRGVFRINLQQPGEPSRRFPRTNVWVDAYSGAVLAVRDPRREEAGDQLLNWLHAVHSGEAGGLPGRLLALFSGLGTAGLFVTGWIRWRHKVDARRRAGR